MPINPPPQPAIVETRKIPVVVFILAGIALLAASASAGYWLGTGYLTKKPWEQTKFSDFITLRIMKKMPATTPLWISYPSSQPETAILPPEQTNEPQKINSLELIVEYVDESGSNNDLKHYEKYLFADNNSEYLDYGKISYKNTPANLIVVKPGQEGIGDYRITYLFASTSNKIYLLAKYSDDLGKNISNGIDERGFIRSKFSVDNSFDIPALNFPDKLTAPGKNMILTFVTKDFSTDYRGQKNAIAFKDKNWGNISTSDDTGLFYIDTGWPYIGVYEYVLNYDNITWNDGSKNQNQYTYSRGGGCGSFNYINIAPKVDKNNDLIKAGTAANGEIIYELADKNHQLLKDIYESVYYQDPETQAKISYERFVADKPVMFLIDPLGRIIILTNQRYQMGAECGKPVIYLYPEKTSKISVELAPNGGFTYTEPEYNNGWEVMAEPSGALTEIKSGKTYPYLFWEGNGNSKSAVPNKKGFVVAKENVKNFLDEKLALLGLNTKETADFEEFWLPRMQEKPYYFVTFYGKQMMDEIAPLQISPAPDTVIRILMDFTPLDASMAVQEQKLSAPVRRGFTVVEWGGVLR